MRIIFICNELPPAPWGGIGQTVAMIAPKLGSMGHEICIVGIYDKEYHWKQDNYKVLIAKPKISLFRRIFQKPLIAKYLPQEILFKIHYSEKCRAIRRQIHSLTNSNQPIIIEWPSYEGQFNWHDPAHTHVLRAQGATAMPAYSRDKNAKQNSKNEIAMARRIRNWIGVSQWSLDEMERITGTVPRNKTVVYNPVDCNLFFPSEFQPDNQTVLYAGTLCERKGDDRLALAANKFLAECKQSRLLFVGRHTPDRPQKILSKIEPELRDRVEIRPASTHHELSKIMQSAAVFAMPSRGETFGMVYAEAMACGVPVVAGDKTAMPEIIPDGKAGYLVDAENPEAISSAIIKLLKSPEARKSMGKYGREIAVKKYSVETCVDDTLSFYNHCIQQKKID